MLFKLSYYGVRVCSLQWFQSHLSGRFQYTELDGGSSNYRLILLRVSPGVGTWPFALFVICVTFNVAVATKCILYADDTVLLLSGDNLPDLLANVSSQFSLFSKCQ